MRTLWAGDSSVLTDIRAAGVEQVLVHHWHAILGKRTGHTGNADRLLCLPSMSDKGQPCKSSASILAVSCWVTLDGLPPTFLGFPLLWLDPNTYQAVL